MSVQDQTQTAVQVTPETETPAHGVLVTDVAAAKVKSLLEQEDGDLVRDYDGVEVVVDRMSAPYLEGASIDFSDTIEKQGFTIDNPNAGSSCACGDSFS
jgi:iron-sulfur cluster assembly accessory protein